MVGKNIKYYRLLNRMTMSSLAEKLNITSMAISNYEKGLRNPDIETLRKIADVFGIGIAKLVAPQNDSLVYRHGHFRKNSALTVSLQDYVKSSVEKHFDKFFVSVQALGNNVLPDAPICNRADLSVNPELNAGKMREWLGLPKNGPICNIMSILENNGFLLYVLDLDDHNFSGINGFVNGRPYIIVNEKMNPERQRSSIAHELAHLCFDWPAKMNIKEVEKMATAISGAFLFPEDDAIRELGVRRSAIEKDMTIVAVEYGISMLLLAMRARVLKIVSEAAYKTFIVHALRIGWRKNEPSRIPPEKTLLFEQLTYRAVVEGYISVQKGAELLDKAYEDVEKACFLGEAG